MRCKGDFKLEMSSTLLANLFNKAEEPLDFIFHLFWFYTDVI